NNSFTYEVEKDYSNSDMLRENRLEPISYINQKNSASEKDHDFSYNGNIFYQISEKSTLGAFFGLGRDQENEHQLLFTQTSNIENDILASYERANEGIDHSWQYRGGLDFKKTFDNENQVLDFKTYYSTRNDN